MTKRHQRLKHKMEFIPELFCRGRSPELAAFASFRRSTGPAHALGAPLAHYCGLGTDGPIGAGVIGAPGFGAALFTSGVVRIEP